MNDPIIRDPVARVGGGRAWHGPAATELSTDPHPASHQLARDVLVRPMTATSKGPNAKLGVAQ